MNAKLLVLANLADKHKDEQFCDFMEDQFLSPEVELLKEIGGHVTNLKRVGDGLGVFQYDHETLGD